MKKILLQTTVVLTVLGIFSFNVYAHCEIPCGIYNDEMRITMLKEHIKTIEKSMNQILKLQNKGNSNQLVRWINNKEDHANEFQHIVSQYFLTQRIKTGAKDYEKKLELLHKMLVYAMKCKQTTDLDNIKKLRKAVKEFQKIYF